MTTGTRDSLFQDTLKYIFYAERKILHALPKMQRAAQSAELKRGYETHRALTEGQVERLQQVFVLIGKRPQGKTCPAIDGILDAGAEVIEGFKGSPALDAGLVVAAQAVEHFEIARYGTLCARAQTLGHTQALALLRVTLDEEHATDAALNGLADGSVNAAAVAEAALTPDQGARDPGFTRGRVAGAGSPSEPDPSSGRSLSKGCPGARHVSAPTQHVARRPDRSGAADAGLCAGSDVQPHRCGRPGARDAGQSPDPCRPFPARHKPARLALHNRAK